MEENAVFLPGSIDTGFSFGRNNMKTTFDGSAEDIDTGEDEIIVSNTVLVEDSPATDKVLASLPIQVHISPPEDDLSSENLDPENNEEAAIITSHEIIADEKDDVTLEHFEKSAGVKAENIDHKASEIKCADPHSSENNPNEDNDISTDEEIINTLDDADTDDDDDDDDANL
eukprot:301401_1